MEEHSKPESSVSANYKVPPLPEASKPCKTDQLKKYYSVALGCTVDVSYVDGFTVNVRSWPKKRRVLPDILGEVSVDLLRMGQCHRSRVTTFTTVEEQQGWIDGIEKELTAAMGIIKV